MAHRPLRVEAPKDDQREDAYMKTARAERQRVSQIRQAHKAAQHIQRAWRMHSSKKKRGNMKNNNSTNCVKIDDKMRQGSVKSTKDADRQTYNHTNR